jgi:c-di-AMP phosphodiesterase-like protein
MYERLCFVVIVISMYECLCFVVIVISRYERLCFVVIVISMYERLCFVVIVISRYERFVLLFYIYSNKINISTRLHFISDLPSCFNDCTDKAIENKFLCLTLLIEDRVVSYIFERRLSRDHLSYICPIDFRED